MATVMWDLDGVATLWVEPFYPFMCNELDLAATEWLEWHHYRNHGIEDAHFVELLTKYAEQGGFAEQTVVPEAVEAVKQIKAAGHSQHVVTDRPEAAWADTEWWIDTYLPEIDTLTMGRDKTVFKAYGGPTYYAIDDRVENVEAMRKAGVFAYLLTKPWNEHSDLPRVTTLNEFADIVCGVR